MTSLSAVIKELVMAAVLSERVPASRSKTDWALSALSVLFAVGGLLFTALALNRYLSNIYPPVTAALSGAACLFAVCPVPLLLIHYLRATRPASTKSMPHNVVNGLHTLLESALIELEDPIKDNPKTALLLAALAGFAATNHQERS